MDTPSTGAYRSVRVPVQSDQEWGKPSGSIDWWEHVEAWAKGYGYDQSATRLAERGGFSYGEIVYGLGREPVSWTAEPVSWRGGPDGPGRKSYGEDMAARKFYDANRQRIRPTPPSGE